MRSGVRRRLRRKTRQEAAAALRDAEQAADLGSAKVGCMVMDSSPRRGVVNDAPDLSVGSPVRRRVRAKISAEAAGFSPITARDAAAQGSGGNVEAGKSPGRRLNRKTSEAELGLVFTATASQKDAVVAGSSSVSRTEVRPPKRLRRKTSREDAERVETIETPAAEKCRGEASGVANFRDVPRGSLLKRRKRDADDIKPPSAAGGHVQELAPSGTVGVGSAADARERQLKAAESRREKSCSSRHQRYGTR